MLTLVFSFQLFSLDVKVAGQRHFFEPIVHLVNHEHGTLIICQEMPVFSFIFFLPGPGSLYAFVVVGRHVV